MGEIKPLPGIIYLKDKSIPIMNVKDKCKKINIDDIVNIEYYESANLGELLKIWNDKNSNKSKQNMSSDDNYYPSYMYRKSINSIVTGPSVKALLKFAKELGDRSEEHTSELQSPD